MLESGGIVIYADKFYIRIEVNAYQTAADYIALAVACTFKISYMHSVSYVIIKTHTHIVYGGFYIRALRGTAVSRQTDQAAESSTVGFSVNLVRMRTYARVVPLEVHKGAVTHSAEHQTGKAKTIWISAHLVTMTCQITIFDVINAADIRAISAALMRPLIIIVGFNKRGTGFNGSACAVQSGVKPTFIKSIVRIIGGGIRENKAVNGGVLIEIRIGQEHRQLAVK